MSHFSIILPVFNGCDYIEEAIISVLDQSYKDFELLIVDDGSTDVTVKIIEPFLSDDRIHYYHKRHTGLSDTLNLGLSYASGEYISRIDADDRWLPEKLSTQYKQLKENIDISIIGSSIYYINSRGIRIPELSGFNHGKEIPYDELKRCTLRNNIICSSSLVFHKSVADAIGNFNTKYEISMDYDFLVRALEHHKGMVSEKALVEYRISPQMMTLRERQNMIRESSRIRLHAVKAYNASFGQRLNVIKDILGLYIGGISYRITGQHPVSSYLD